MPELTPAALCGILGPPSNLGMWNLAGSWRTGLAIQAPVLAGTYCCHVNRPAFFHHKFFLHWNVPVSKNPVALQISSICSELPVRVARAVCSSTDGYKLFFRDKKN